MDERLFAQLDHWLPHSPVVLASVMQVEGATPRHGGSRMLITPDATAASIGGGEAEARVVAAARALIESGERSDTIAIDLGGGAGAAGICGGRMQISLRQWKGEEDRQRVGDIATGLRDGNDVRLTADDLGSDLYADNDDQIARPDPRLLIVGAGHCGLALFEMARHLDFDLWVHDSRDGHFDDGRFEGAHVLCGDAHLLGDVAATQRELYAVLLNRDFHADVAALQVLSPIEPAFLGMMGSRRRIGTVLQALPDLQQQLKSLVAPVGLVIGAESPEEIAVSVLAQLIQYRRDRE